MSWIIIGIPLFDSGMGSTFSSDLTHAHKEFPRLVEAAKHDAKKYLKRERNKKLLEGADYWDFECKYGETEQQTKTTHLSEINKHIDQAEQQGLESFYLEILAKPGVRNKG